MIAALLLAPACGGEEDGSAPKRVTIETEIDFSEEPSHGTFEVTEGADALGCSSGRFEDSPDHSGGVHKVLACEDGSKEGTFTAWFNPSEGGGSGDQSGPWRIAAATGDFRGLKGEGDFSVEYESTSDTGVETLTGEIQYP